MEALWVGTWKNRTDSPHDLFGKMIVLIFSEYMSEIKIPMRVE